MIAPLCTRRRDVLIWLFAAGAEAAQANDLQRAQWHAQEAVDMIALVDPPRCGCTECQLGANVVNMADARARLR